MASTFREAWIRDPRADGWLHFTKPEAVFSASKPGEAAIALAEIEKAVSRKGFWAAGFLAYEAASVFDPALTTLACEHFPLVWFGIYNQPSVIASLPKSGSLACDIQPWIPDTDENTYKAAMARIRELLAAGATYQVNYTMRMRSLFEGSAWTFFRNLTAAQPADYSAFLDTGEYCMASVSPELFFQLENRKLLCKPMKGTIPRGRTLAEDRAMAQSLRASEKDKAENVMIVDMIRNDMSRIAAPATVAAPRLFDIERYPTIWQMTSTVECRTRADVPEILAALFPCASITGAPKPNTMRIISNLETSPRRIYTGCLGYWAPDRRARFNVAIRTAIINRANGMAEYGVGGGIVWDSIAASEYRECFDKARVLTEPNQPFALLETILWTRENGFWLLDYHFRRLAESAEYFGFHFDCNAIHRALDNAASQSRGVLALRMRLLLHPDGEARVESVNFDSAKRSTPLRVTLAEKPVDPANRFLFHKTTRRELYEEALSKRPDFDDVLLWNTRGELTESTVANVIIEQPGAPPATPLLSCGLLPGAYRAWLLDHSGIIERVIPVSELKPGMRLALVNSLRGRREAVFLPSAR